MLLFLPGAASGLEAGVLVGVTEQKSRHFGRAEDAGVAPTVGLMLGGAPRSWVSLAGELRVSWYRNKEDFVGSFTHLGLRSFFDIRTRGDQQALKEFALTLAPGLGFYDMHAGRRGLRPPPSSHENGLYASAMIGLTGWTMQSIAIGAFVEYALLLPFSSCVWHDGGDTLDCDRSASGNTHLGLLTYGLLIRF